MSQENVEIVARSIDAFNRAFNRGDLEGFLEMVTPDIEWLPVMGAMHRDGSFRGRTGVEAYFDALRDAWEDLAFAPGYEVRDLGEKTLMVGRLQGRGRGSGVTIHTPIAVLYDHRGGQISRIRSFYDPVEALKAVGLAE
jgi:ketosteroid isomerase-like protein